MAAGVSADSPPSRPRLAMERTNARVLRRDLQARAIAEQRATRAPRGRIDRDHAHRALLRPTGGDQPRDQAGFADPGGPVMPTTCARAAVGGIEQGERRSFVRRGFDAGERAAMARLPPARRASSGSGRAALNPAKLRAARRERRLRRGKARDRHAVGRAGHVVEPDPLAEADGRGIAAVLAADAELQFRAPAPPALARDLDQRADPGMSSVVNGSASKMPCCR